MAGRTVLACACLALCACGSTVSIDDGSLKTKPSPSTPPSSPPSSDDTVVVADPFPTSPPCGEASGAPELSWAYRAGTAKAQETVAAVATDAAGNVYFTGSGSTDVDFGGGPMAGHAGYVVSLTADGAFRWARFLQGSDWGSAIAVSPSGQIVVAGSFMGPLELGDEVYDANQRNMAFVAALTSMGEVVWYRAFGEGQINIATGVAITPAEDVIVVGSFQHGADFGGGMRHTDGNRDAFVAAYDAGGNHLWDVTPPGPGTEIPIGVAVDGAGQITLAGHFSSEWDLGGGTRHADGIQAAFVLHLDDQGGYLWDWTHGFDGHGLGHAVAADSLGQLYVTGEFHGSLSFADTAHPPTSELSSYVVSFDAAGTERWGRVYEGTGGARAFGIAVDDSDRVLLAGHFAGQATFGSSPQVSAGGYDTFALMLTGAGDHLWDRTFGGSKDEEGHAIVRGCTGTLFVGGRDPGNDTGSLVSMDALLIAFD